MGRVPSVEELPGRLDPMEVARRFLHWPHLLFLDSSDRVSPLGRYSFISADPIRWLTTSASAGDPWQRLRDFHDVEHPESLPALPPFQGGVAGLLGYELGHATERFPYPRFDEFHVPDLAVGYFDWVIAFDHRREKCWLIAHTDDRMRQVRDVVAREASPIEWSATAVALDPIAPHYRLPGHEGVFSDFDRRTYLETVARAVEYVHAGDCFQVNIAQRLLAPLREHPWRLYERLRTRNPSPFGAYFDTGDHVIASSSPERFLKVNGRSVESRPIKGTRRRTPHPVADDAIRDELAASAKDRAENVMIVDLLRNDLGRVCEYGSVRVPQVCGVETYRFVHHLVSVVEGRLRGGCSAVDLLRAAFPGGSVTGAPKVRSMEIISELEPTVRGPYCGSLGYLGYGDAVDFNILIRTFTAGGGWAQFPVGGGIVADSDPAQEYEETLDKAAGMLAALEVAAGLPASNLL